MPPISTSQLMTMTRDQRTDTITSLPAHTRIALTHLIALGTELNLTRLRRFLETNQTALAHQLLDHMAERAHLTVELTTPSKYHPQLVDHAP